MKRITILLAAAALVAGCTDQTQPLEPQGPVAAVRQTGKASGSPFHGIAMSGVDRGGSPITLVLDVAAFEAAMPGDTRAPLTMKGLLTGVDNPDLKTPVRVLLAADLAKLAPGHPRSCDGTVQIAVGIAVDNPDLRDVSVDNPDLLPAVQLEPLRIVLDASDPRNRRRAGSLICGIARALESGDSWESIAGQMTELVETYELPAVQRWVTAASADAATAASESIDDALARIVPHLTDVATARTLTGVLGALRTALASRDPASATAQLTTAYAAVERFTRANGDDADTDAIRLALDLARTTLDLAELAR